LVVLLERDREKETLRKVLYGRDLKFLEMRLPDRIHLG